MCFASAHAQRLQKCHSAFLTQLQRRSPGSQLEDPGGNIWDQQGRCSRPEPLPPPVGAEPESSELRPQAPCGSIVDQSDASRLPEAPEGQSRGGLGHGWVGQDTPASLFMDL